MVMARVLLPDETSLAHGDWSDRLPAGAPRHGLGTVGSRWRSRTTSRCRSPARSTATGRPTACWRASTSCARNPAARTGSSSTTSTARSTSSTRQRRRSRPISISTAARATPGLFHKFTYEAGYANGLISFQFDPDYRRNGRFYTMHIEDRRCRARPCPTTRSVPGLTCAATRRPRRSRRPATSSAKPW